jgi:hypothetical protein
MTAVQVTIAGRTLEEWAEFARTDTCLDRMVPSDLRMLVASHRDATATINMLQIPQILLTDVTVTEADRNAAEAAAIAEASRYSPEAVAKMLEGVVIPDDEPRQIVCTGEAGSDKWEPAFGTWEADDFGMDSDEPVGAGERLFVNRRIYDDLNEHLHGAISERDRARTRAEAAEARVAELEALPDRSVYLANHRQANCINFTAQALGPNYAATIDALPKAALHVAMRAEAAEARVAELEAVLAAFAEHFAEIREDENDRTKMPVRIGYLRKASTALQETKP